MNRSVASLLIIVMGGACKPAPVFIGDEPPDGGDAAVQMDSSVPDSGQADSGLPDSGQDATVLEDGGVDAGTDSGTFGPGDYTIDFVAIVSPDTVVCMAALGGREADFSGVTPADVNMTAGPVTMTSTSAETVYVSGAPILSAFGVNTLRLDMNIAPKQPPGTYLGGAPISGTGPIGTHLAQGVLAIDTLVSQQNGLAGVIYENATLDGQCFVTFLSTITPR